MAQAQKPTHIKPNLETALTFGKKKTSIAVATVTMGKGMIRVNGVPLHLVEPEVMRTKIMEPILLIGQQKFAKIDIRVKVKGGGYVSQIYSIR
jgi:small subunit ribosomal protein S16e